MFHVRLSGITAIQRRLTLFRFSLTFPCVSSQAFPMSQSEHDLSDSETPPNPSGRRSSGNRFTRGIFNDVDGTSSRAREGWLKATSFVKSLTSVVLAALKSVDWTGYGRLVRLCITLLSSSYSLHLAARYNSLPFLLFSLRF